MYAVLKSFGLKGLNGFPVEVEADISGGMPALSIVGLPDSAVRESGDRVHAALKNLGFKWPDRRITINLAPADVRKTGPVYVPLLLAVLAASGQLEPPPKDTAFLGSWRWTAVSARCPASCPWRWRLLPAVCGRSMSLPRTLPKPLKPAAARCGISCRNGPSGRGCAAGRPAHPAYDACPLRPCRCVEPCSRFR